MELLDLRNKLESEKKALEERIDATGIASDLNEFTTKASKFGIDGNKGRKIYSRDIFDYILSKIPAESRLMSYCTTENNYIDANYRNYYHTICYILIDEDTLLELRLVETVEKGKDTEYKFWVQKYNNSVKDLIITYKKECGYQISNSNKRYSLYDLNIKEDYSKYLGKTLIDAIGITDLNKLIDNILLDQIYKVEIEKRNEQNTVGSTINLK